MITFEGCLISFWYFLVFSFNDIVFVIINIFRIIIIKINIIMIINIITIIIVNINIIKTINIRCKMFYNITIGKN